MSCPFAFDDGAYILGALAPAERAAFERHLPTCDRCREAMATLAVLPGLLARLDPNTAAPTTTAPPTLLPRTLHAAAELRRSQRRRSRRQALVGAVAAAVIAVLTGVGVHLADRDPAGPPPAAVASSPVYSAMRQTPLNVSIQADIALTGAATGTWIGMRCRYDEPDGKSWPIWLVVFPRNGGPAESVGSWMTIPGEEVALTALTHVAPADIARVELQGPNHTTLLWWAPP